LKPVRIWLYGVAALVLAMVVLGGITRLTGSGLSITEWQPISGAIPPMNTGDWLAEFEAYKQIPQYRELNAGMSLEEFKFIFWWEWTHRLLGRIIGIAFAVPFLIFLIQRRFSWRLATPLAGLFLLGGLQGAIGWWMVSSGLSVLTSVSQYRLATHLFAASLLFIALIWVARRLEPRMEEPTPTRLSSGASASERSRVGVGAGRRRNAVSNTRPLRWPIAILLCLVLLQIVAGAFVAGLDAGMSYNTWPLMGSTFVPAEVAELSPFWRNLFENVATVQFDHRIIAYVVVAYVAALMVFRGRAGGFPGAEGWLPRIGVLVLLQVALGIATLLTFVPIWLALGHQALAFMLAGTIAAYLADLTPRYYNTAR
jgi:cytochrome c oxidase assembly protein subunit 15